MHFNPHISSFTRGVLAALAMLIAGSIPARAQLNVGITGGMAGSITSEGVANHSETRFRSSRTYGGSAGYRFPKGLTLGVRAEMLEMALNEENASFGTLRMTPVMFTIGYQGRPSEGRGFTGHAQFGGGMALADFEKGPFLTGLESTYGVQFRIQTGNAPVFEIGGGFDYFVSRHVSFISDFRIVFANVGTQWSVVGRQTVAMPDVDKFYASNAQVLGGIRFWLK